MALNLTRSVTTTPSSASPTSAKRSWAFTSVSRAQLTPVNLAQTAAAPPTTIDLSRFARSNRLPIGQGGTPQPATPSDQSQQDQSQQDSGDSGGGGGGGYQDSGQQQSQEQEQQYPQDNQYYIDQNRGYDGNQYTSDDDSQEWSEDDGYYGETSVPAHVASLVERARAGDQNAMGIISLVGEQHKRGNNPRASQTFKFIYGYCKANPPGTMANPRIGIDRNSDNWGLAVAYSHGPLLKNDHIHGIVAQFGAEDQPLLTHALVNYRQRNALNGLKRRVGRDRARVVEMGRQLGLARAIQRVRMHGSDIRRFNPSVGWELGC